MQSLIDFPENISFCVAPCVPEDIPNMSDEYIKDLHVMSLSVDMIKNLTPHQITLIAPHKIAEFEGVQIQALTAQQIPHLSELQLCMLGINI